MTFSPASDLQTQKLVWSCFKNHQQMKHNDEPQVFNSVYLAGMFANRHADDVKKVTF